MQPEHHIGSESEYDHSHTTHTSGFSRRRFMEGALLAGAAFSSIGLFGPGANSAHATASAPAHIPHALRSRIKPATHVSARQIRRPFELSAVNITGGVFKRGLDQGLELARAYPIDRLLAIFRRNAGLDTRGANPPGGWEEYGPNPEAQRWGPAEYTKGQNRGAGGLLRGHYAGHFLSQLALAYENTGESALYDRVVEFVKGLKECQEALAKQTYNGKPRYSHPGFLSAYGEWQFSVLEEYAPYGEIWAPYYTLHKILDGLLHAYHATGEPAALEVAEGIGRWVHSRLSKCTQAQLDKMWKIYIGGEYGGMNDVLIELYWASSAADKAIFLQAAKFFDMNDLLDACARGEDTLTDKHANQHIPQFVGYAKMYAETGEERYLNAVKGFFDMIVPGRMYPHGGTGEGEMWGPPHKVAGDIGPRNAESCAAYNMVKVAWQLYQLTGEQRYANYCERTVLNHILGGHRDASSKESPENLYMFPVNAGARKEYGDGNIGTCCGGTGLESPMRYQETVYAAADDGKTLYVNTYVPSTLTWEEQATTVRVATEYPYQGRVTITFDKAPSGEFTLALRIPEWVSSTPMITVNGTPSSAAAGANSYATITRSWASGDSVVLDISLPAWIESAPDNAKLQTLRYGPMVLSVAGDAPRFPVMALGGLFNLSGTLNDAIEWKDGQIRLGGRDFDPAHAGHDITYSMYFERKDKTVVFRSVDSGVINPVSASDPTTTLVDDIWKAAPFANRDAFLEQVRQITKKYQDQGSISARDRQRILVAAGRARMGGK
ncbi:beta-L-arabinofuranosidase domain-containing protein [Trueperella sp. LYQ143]|uniref:beta-L-arabinofuranosidase domain-containing protein n=1 Tax=unclassified Trueperella TaxID=2630174 RepID=UPI003983C75B